MLHQNDEKQTAAMAADLIEDIQMVGLDHFMLTMSGVIEEWLTTEFANEHGYRNDALSCLSVIRDNINRYKL